MGNIYLSKIVLRSWIKKWLYLKDFYSIFNYKSLNLDFQNKLDKIIDVMNNPEDFLIKRNDVYIKNELVLYENFFDS